MSNMKPALKNRVEPAPTNNAEPACPFCDSLAVELVSAWGGQLITRQLRCRHCNTHFEAVRDDFGTTGMFDGK